jgi:glycosyltransferase involved in cell wall biosynthesis
MATNDSAGVSVIIPAHNAAGTLSETLDSLLAQTSDSWEALIVDDGSSDDTLLVASAYANRDARIHYVRREWGGVSAARNAGVTLAGFDWLLFLDADDWLLPSYLERMIGVLESGLGVDAVFCGSARVTPDGIRVREVYRDESDDIFETFACRRVFPIHACVVRKSIVWAGSILHSARARIGISGSESPVQALASSAYPKTCSHFTVCFPRLLPWTPFRCSRMAFA